MDFEVRTHTFEQRELPVHTYISLSTNTVNPLLLKEEMELFVDYIKEKYSTPKPKSLSFKEHVLKMFKSNNI